MAEAKVPRVTKIKASLTFFCLNMDSQRKRLLVWDFSEEGTGNGKA